MVAAGINLLECSPQAAVRRVMVLFASGYTLAVLLFPVWSVYPDKNHWSCSVANPFALPSFGLLTAAVCLCGSSESCR